MNVFKSNAHSVSEPPHWCCHPVCTEYLRLPALHKLHRSLQGCLMCCLERS